LASAKAIRAVNSKGYLWQNIAMKEKHLLQKVAGERTEEMIDRKVRS
jgi:hypothetical protein